MTQELYPVPSDWAAKARITKDNYDAQYPGSIADPEAFWAETGKRIDWIKPYSSDAIKDVSYDADDPAYPLVS